MLTRWNWWRLTWPVRKRVWRLIGRCPACSRKRYTGHKMDCARGWN